MSLCLLGTIITYINAYQCSKYSFIDPVGLIFTIIFIILMRPNKQFYDKRYYEMHSIISFSNVSPPHGLGACFKNNQGHFFQKSLHQVL